MKENNKKKIISLGIILALFIALPFGICYFSFAVLPLFDETTVKTSCGDTFQISYDSFRVKSLVTDTNSGFYVILNDKVANANKMPELRWYYELFHNDPAGHQLSSQYLKRAYLSDKCDQKTVDMLFDSYLDVLGWGTHHFPEGCIIESAVKEDCIQKLGIR